MAPSEQDDSTIDENRPGHRRGIRSWHRREEEKNERQREEGDGRDVDRHTGPAETELRSWKGFTAESLR